MQLIVYKISILNVNRGRSLQVGSDNNRGNMGVFMRVPSYGG